MKKTLLWLVVLILIVSIAGTFSFAGCKAEEEVKETTEEVAEETAEEVVEEEAEETEEESAEIIDLYYMGWMGQDRGFPEAFEEAYNAKYPNQRLHYVMGSDADSSEYLQGLTARVLAGTLDVAAFYDSHLLEFYEAGHLVEVTDQPFLNNFNPGHLFKITFDGKVLGFPSTINQMATFYNKDIFSEMGLSVPTDWDEYMELLNTLKDAGYYMANPAADLWGMSYDIYPFGHSLNVRQPDIWEKINNGEVKYTDDVWMDILKDIEAFYQAGYLHPDLLSLGYMECLQLFADQDAAIYYHGDWLPAGLDDIELDFEWDLFVQPAPGIENTVPVVFGAHEAALATSEHPKEALQLLEFIASPEGAAIWTEYLNFFSPIIGAPTPEGSIEKFAPLLEEKAIYQWTFLLNNEVKTEFYKGLQEMFAGSIGPEELAERMQEVQERQ